MATVVGPIYLAPKASTGNNTHTTLPLAPEFDNHGIQFIIEAVGATPTITFKLQGSFDNVNWYDAAYITDSVSSVSQAALTKTAVGAYALFLDLPLTRDYPFLRLVTSANTNVTYRCELYETNALA